MTGAVLTLLLSAFLLVLMFYYLRTTRQATAVDEGRSSWLRNPWGQPRLLPLITIVYIVWSIVPVAIAILFAFNDGRSRTTWQGFSFRWFTGATGSVFHDPALQGALEHTLVLAVICVAVATPLGVALALGLQRWRGPGRRDRQHAHAAAARDARRS